MRPSSRLLAGIVAIAFGSACSQKHPPEVSLERAFAEHRPAFEQLAELAVADTGLWQVSDSWYVTSGGAHHIVPSAALPAERWRRYRALFRSFGFDAEVSIDDGVVYVRRSESGPSVGGDKLVHWRFSTPPTPICRSLDPPRPANEPPASGVCYKALADNWYLFQSQS